ncbi:nickel/cobalt transporter [Arcobacter sp.]|uniref:nickel/cobalt transporter n=1 Tax=Arcobacter sp. TaxID=1872629 RepID=UPI003D09CD74
MHFKYKIKLNYKIVKDNILYFSIEDNEQFFLIELEKNGITFDKEIFQENIIDLNSVSFYIIKEFVSEKKEDPLEVKKENIIKADENFLTKFNKKIKENLIEIKNGNNIALITLLFVSFLYGIVHALGPGHGKSLAFSYFMATKSSYIKAFVISQVTAFIHIVGALILVLISIFIIESFFNSFVNDSIKLITKLSALFIMLLALYLLYKKFKNKSSSSPSCCSHHHEEKSTKKQDIFFVLTAGIIPCPGTVILFLYAFILKTYLAVILASIFISLGMGMVIFMSSFFSIKINKLTNNYQKVKNFIEIASPIFIFILGLLLFFNTNII